MGLSKLWLAHVVELLSVGNLAPKVYSYWLVVALLKVSAILWSSLCSTVTPAVITAAYLAAAFTSSEDEFRVVHADSESSYSTPNLPPSSASVM